jgi:hypothetical protein
MWTRSLRTTRTSGCAGWVTGRVAAWCSPPPTAASSWRCGRPSGGGCWRSRSAPTIPTTWTGSRRACGGSGRSSSGSGRGGPAGARSELGAARQRAGQSPDHRGGRQAGADQRAGPARPAQRPGAGHRADQPGPAAQARARSGRLAGSGGVAAVLHPGPGVQGQRPCAGAGLVHAVLDRPSQPAGAAGPAELPASHRVGGRRHRRGRAGRHGDAGRPPGAARLGAGPPPHRVQLLLVPQGPGRQLL